MPLVQKLKNWLDYTTDILMNIHAQNVSICLKLVRPHTEYVIQVWNPHLQKDTDHHEGVQKFACAPSSQN